MEDYTTNNFMYCHQDADHDIIHNKRRFISVNIHNPLDFAVFFKVHSQLSVSSDSNDGEIRCM